MWQRLKAGWDNWFRITPADSLYDRALLWVYFSLLAIGLVAVSSASIPISQRLHHESFHFAISEGVFILLSLCVFTIVLLQPMSRWEKLNIWFFFISIALLVLVIFVGKEVNGAKRWLVLGPVNFQASELAKLAIISFLSSLYVRRYEELRKEWHGAWRPFCVLLVFFIILSAQSDLGSIFIIFAIAVSMLFIMRARIPQFFLLALVGGVALYFYVTLFDYRMKRFAAYADPFADVYGDGFQLANSQMAFGQGEIWGRGLGNSIQKLEYLPEAHTDFITAVIGEEFGLIGITFLVFLFACLLMKAFNISRESLKNEQHFKGFFAFGIGSWFFLQGFMNLGGAMGLLPSKGLTFPFVSYGGSSMVIFSMAIAVLVRIDHENRVERLGYTRAKRK